MIGSHEITLADERSLAPVLGGNDGGIDREARDQGPHEVSTGLHQVGDLDAVAGEPGEGVAVDVVAQAVGGGVPAERAPQPGQPAEAGERPRADLAGDVDAAEDARFLGKHDGLGGAAGGGGLSATTIAVAGAAVGGGALVAGDGTVDEWSGAPLAPYPTIARLRTLRAMSIAVAAEIEALDHLRAGGADVTPLARRLERRLTVFLAAQPTGSFGSLPRTGYCARLCATTDLSSVTIFRQALPSGSFNSGSIGQSA